MTDTKNNNQPLKVAAKSLGPDTLLLASHRAESPVPSALIGQQRAVQSLTQALRVPGRYAHCYLSTMAGIRTHDVLEAVIGSHAPACDYRDWLYVANPADGDRPICIDIVAGSAEAFVQELAEFLSTTATQREALAAQLVERFAGQSTSQRLANYIDKIKPLTFAEFPGDELANIIVSHDQRPLYYRCERVTEAALFGSIRLQSVQGTISSNLHLIEAGALLRANGGLLVIDAAELLRAEGLWRCLKHILKTSQFEWPQPGDANIAAFYEPEPIPIRVKVILCGERDIFAQLREIDADFDNLFPFLADLVGHYSITQAPIADYFQYLAYVHTQANVKSLSQDAYPTLLNFCAKQTDYQHELTLDTIALMQLLREADCIASAAQREEITAADLSEAQRQADARHQYIAELSHRAILEEQVYIATDGTAVGQINGLTVISAGGTEFGEPSRITATVHYGDGDIIDIERKSELSGNIHTKGIMILTAFIANLFAREEPMSLSATVVFEQSYHEVDGDSASMAELCCLLSAFADAPLQQGFACTGAVDQFGRVQAIGAVNEKIEGYFAICKARGLTGQQGVILPTANLSQLNLSPAVVQAVAAEQFHIFAVSHVEQAIELLCNLPAEQLYEAIRERLSSIHHGEKPRSLWQRWFG